MSEQHTEGPWHALESVPGAVKAWDSKDESTLYVVISSDESELLANARLIAAAPALLSALRNLYDLVAEEVADGEYTEQAVVARAAIAKATGKTA